MRGGWLVLLAACRLGFEATDMQPGLELAVEPVYPDHAGWNDYVKRADPEVPCDATTALVDCVRGGEARRVAIPGATSCAGLALRDELDGMQWRCVETDGAVAFVGGGLKPDRGLRDLLASDHFLDERVVLSRNGVAIGASPLETWWPDTVMPLPGDPPSGPAVLLAQGIYTVDTSRTSHGVNIKGERIAIVTLGNAVLSYDGGATMNCAYDAGPTTVSDPTSEHCLIASHGARFLWIEARLSGAPAAGTAADTAIKLVLSSHSVIRATRAAGFAKGALALKGVTASQIYDVAAAATTAATSGALLGIGSGTKGNTFQRIRLTESSFQSIGFDANTGGNTFVDLVAAHSPTTCVAGFPGPATLSHALIAGCDMGESIYSLYSHDVTTVQLVAVANHININLLSNANATFANTVTVDAPMPVRITNATGTRFTGALVTKPPCYSDNVPDSGLADQTCVNLGPSDATLTTANTLANTFVGGGVPRSLAEMTEWIADDPYTTWGPDAPLLTPVGKCTAGNCRAWNWRPRPDDIVVRERSGDGVHPNERFVTDAPCPSAARGDRAITDALQNTFLIAAVEIPGDGLGDDDGLCESGEACIYSPHLGVYQGEGDYTQQRCAFQDGLVAGVTLYAYPIR